MADYLPDGTELKPDAVMRPWGTYKVLHEDGSCKVKRIVVFPGHRLSLQSHNNRDEVWTIVSGQGKVEIDNDTFTALQGKVFRVFRQQKHRIQNTSPAEMLVFIETQLGTSFDESDIIRHQDDYGRV